LQNRSTFIPRIGEAPDFFIRSGGAGF
jgi:hypothetical protein